MDIKEAIVLAGGLGTRLQGVLPGIPKCMAPVKGKPFLTYVLDYLQSQQVNKVVLSVGYRKEHIINFFGEFYKDLLIEYAVENEPLGTGGAVKFAISHCSQDKMFVINGDTYFFPDLNGMENQHFQSSADITIAAKQMKETGRYGLLIVNPEGRITEFREKDAVVESGLINGGIYLINRNIFDDVTEQKFSIENDVFKVSCSTLHLHAYPSDAFFLDMGVPEDLAKAQTMANLTDVI